MSKRKIEKTERTFKVTSHKRDVVNGRLVTVRPGDEIPLELARALGLADATASEPAKPIKLGKRRPPKPFRKDVIAGQAD